MEVVLLQGVSKVGKTGEIKNVSDGFAQNYLLPRKLAVIATFGARQAALAAKEAQEKRQERRLKEIDRLKEKLEGHEILVRGSVAEGDKLYAGIGPKEISAAILKRKKMEVPSHAIKIKGNKLKELGSHQAVLHIGGVDIPFTVVVESSERG